MVFDQRLEETPDGTYIAVNYNYPQSLVAFEDEKDYDQGLSNLKSNSRLVFTEVPCCHCPLSE